jgi:Ca2+-binding RTX toxin-like protein
MTGASGFATAAAVAASIALLAAPGSALAGVASIDSDGIPRYDADPGDVNSVTVAERLQDPAVGFKTVVFRDVGDEVRVRAEAPCRREGLTSVVCTVPFATGLIRAALEDQNDRIEPDAFQPPRVAGFSVEGDGGNDTLIGTFGRDVLDGVGGDDRILGGDGNDNLQGAGGDDDISGQGGDDTLTGGGQADDLNGGTGRDTMLGGTGNDNLNANDHAGGDTLDCGTHLFDSDLAVFNLGDTVNSNCERTRLEL